MTEPEPSSPPYASPLALPAAVLHSTSPPLHPDSEEFVQSERHRTAKELKTFRDSSAPKPAFGLSSDPTQARLSPSIRARGASSRNSRQYGPSEAPTVADSEGPEAYNVRRHRLRRQVPHWYDPIVKFWTTKVNVTIDEGSHRDHLALERTFLGYLRTSLMFAMTGVLIAQLFRLQHTVNPNLNLGFFVLGIPLATSFIGFGAIVLLVGAVRFWRQQNAMIRGKVYSHGWEISIIMLVSIILCLVTLVLLTAIDIDKSYD